MDTLTATTKYKNYCFLGRSSATQYAVVLLRLSYRDVEELLFERGVVVTYE
jgi:hypothetical protein